MKKIILITFFFSINSWALMMPKDDYDTVDVPSEVYNYEDNLDMYNKDRTEEYDDYKEEPYSDGLDYVEPQYQYEADTNFEDYFDNVPKALTEPYYEEEHYNDEDYNDSY